MQELDLTAQNINTIRFLAVDAVEKAKSGHPGTPMGAAAIAYVLWDKFLKHNPEDPNWFNRDRFVLSAGHASMLLYSMLYLTGYSVSLNDIKQFRQLGSITPGHPEFGLTPGVEATAGPLGQGFANGVGMAIAEMWLARRYNRPGYEIINHNTFALISDGDLQEGISSEAASLAGTLKLGKLIYIYDSNDIQQDGKTIASFQENVAQRFLAYGWNVIGPMDGLNVIEVENALLAAKGQTAKPNLIICRTIIGYGSPNKAGTNLAHGEPLGLEEVRLSKENLNWKYQEPFSVPADSLDYFRKAIVEGKKAQNQWQELMDNYKVAYASESTELASIINGNLSKDWDNNLFSISETKTPLATRDVSGKVLNAIAVSIPNFIAGAADLAGSTRTYLKGYGDFSAENYAGRNIRFGLREHAMGAITNGLVLHGGIIPCIGTFLVFSDYMRPTIRLAAMMRLRIIYVFSHDSIGVGEDGPTHQPVEQIMSLRLIPNLTVIRPADTAETIEAWKIALTNKKGPTALILTRQGVPVLNRESLGSADGVKKGGYILWESSPQPQAILIGTGSELQIALEAGKLLKEKGVSSRVVSLPCWSIFDQQSEEYKQGVFPSQIKVRLSIEAGTRIGWERYIGFNGKAIGLDRFGISAPGELVYKYFKLTANEMVEIALKIL
jgi:transketolase